MTAAPGSRTNLRNYVLVTTAYWADTLTDGAIRMLVLFHFHQLGYSPLTVASLFLFYEVFGIVTNLCGGYLASRLGLKTTLFMGLGMQVCALGMLAFAPPSLLIVPYVMVAQALSGIAKDLTKMSSKSAVKLIAGETQSQLYRWVSLLTGSKNAIKGVGFFVGAVLLSWLGFQTSLMVLAGLVLTTLLATAILMRGDLGTSNKKAKFSQMFSQNSSVNRLAAARIFLFGARDLWCVVGLPVFLADVLGWSFWMAGGFMALWTIGYGFVQALTPKILSCRVEKGGEPDGPLAAGLAFILAGCPIIIAVALLLEWNMGISVICGLIAFGAAFALNSAVHSYLILAYTDSNKVAMNVGFYYMANAVGRLSGTILSGALFQYSGLSGCLIASAAFVLIAGGISLGLPKRTDAASKPIGLSDMGE
jgi:predicted MFS family arabinose efflux permease